MEIIISKTRISNKLLHFRYLIVLFESGKYIRPCLNEIHWNDFIILKKGLTFLMIPLNYKQTTTPPPPLTIYPFFPSIILYPLFLLRLVFLRVWHFVLFLSVGDLITQTMFFSCWSVITSSIGHPGAFHQNESSKFKTFDALKLTYFKRTCIAYMSDSYYIKPFIYVDMLILMFSHIQKIWASAPTFHQGNSNTGNGSSEIHIRQT